MSYQITFKYQDNTTVESIEADFFDDSHTLEEVTLYANCCLAMLGFKSYSIEEIAEPADCFPNNILPFKPSKL